MGLFTPKNIVHKNEVEQAKFNLIWRLSIVSTIMLTILFASFISDPSDAKYSYLIGLSIVILGLIYLRITHRSKAIYIIYASAATLLILFNNNVILDTPHLANNLWILLVIILALFGTNLKTALIFLGINCFGIIYYAIFSLNDHYVKMQSISFENSLPIGLELICVMSIIIYVVYLFFKTRDSAAKKLTKTNSLLEENNAQILQREEEKTILVKEIHHRVKNNLQIIISLLRLQMMDIKNIEAKEHFSEAINRVMVMSSIHQKLYQEKNLTNFNLQEYIIELSQELKLFFKEEFPIKIEVDVNYENIDLKTIVPIGLLLNELLSNSFKYAFEEKSEGEIKITIDGKNDFFELKFSDSGRWKENKREDNGFGLELLDILTEQLNGTKKVSKTAEGTFYTFNLQSIKDS